MNILFFQFLDLSCFISMQTYNFNFLKGILTFVCLSGSDALFQACGCKHKEEAKFLPVVEMLLQRKGEPLYQNSNHIQLNNMNISLKCLRFDFLELANFVLNQFFYFRFSRFLGFVLREGAISKENRISKT